MVKSKIYNLILIVLIVFTVCFIFSKSVPSIPNSQAESEKVTQIVRPVLEPVVGKGNVSDHLVRKLAHFAEFALLGFELALLFRRFALAPFFISLLVGMSDETIQIFSARGSQVQDVWLDFAGACFGFLLGLAVYYLCVNIAADREKRKQ